jgi:tetratricopeptide (TPR) repeat protein
MEVYFCGGTAPSQGQLMTEEPKEKETSESLANEENATVPAERLFVVLGESLRVQNRLDEAIEALKQGMEKNPEYLPGRLEALKQGMEKNPEYLPGRLLLGRCYLEKGSHGEAKIELEKVAGMIEECLPVYKLLSKVYVYERKDVDKALEAVRRALYFTSQEVAKKKITPMEMGLTPPGGGGFSPESEAGGQKGTGGEQRARAARLAIQTDTLAEIYIKQGKMEKALAIYRDILVQDPNHEAVRKKYEAVLKQMERKNETRAREQMTRKLEIWLAKISSPPKAQ